MLIDDDGVLDISHSQIFEDDVVGGEHGRLVVALDPGPVGCARQSAAREGDVPHAQFVRPLPQTPHSARPGSIIISVNTTYNNQIIVILTRGHVQGRT